VGTVVMTLEHHIEYVSQCSDGAFLDLMNRNGLPPVLPSTERSTQGCRCRYPSPELPRTMPRYRVTANTSGHVPNGYVAVSDPHSVWPDTAVRAPAPVGGIENTGPHWFASDVGRERRRGPHRP